MRGFFSDDEIAKHTKQSSLTEPNCNKCGLYRDCKSPKMGYTGKGEKKILIIAESPGKSEDNQGVQLVGEAGQLLRQYLEELNLDLDRDFWKTNSVSCRPHTKEDQNRKPTKTEIKCCKPMVNSIIKELQPHSIWLMGGVAVDSFFTDRFSNTTISRWVNLCIPDRSTGAWVIPLYHPSYIKRREFDNNLKSEFVRNLKYAVSCNKLESYRHEELDKYTTSLTAFASIKVLLKKILKRADDKYTPLYIDYETTGLKPHWKGSRIATVSIATDRSTAYAFPFQYKDFFSTKEIRKIKSLLRKIMVHPNIGLMAHNIKFEDSWTRNILGVRPTNWLWDTMITAHLIDNRRKYTGLKFQSYIHFGIEPYDKGVSKFLKAASNSHHNNVDKAPLGELLYYNCLDTLLGWRLYEKQQEEFTLTNKLYPRNNLPTAHKLFHDGLLALSDVQENGVMIKEGYYEEKELEVGAKIAEMEHELLSSEEAKEFNIVHKRPLNLASNKDLGLLFYKILGEKEVKTTKGNYKVDKETLEQMDTPIVKKLLDIRKLEKVRGTYFSQIKREVCDGIIHPFYDLHIPRSFRGSSSRPNWQNQPGHDPIAGKLVRSGVVPPKGWYIAEADYCLAGDTLVETIGGPLPIKSIVDTFFTNDIWVYCYKQNKKRIGVSKVINGKLTRKKAPILKIILDNGKEILCTPEHKFMCRNGNYVEAQKLKVGTSLMPLYQGKTTRDGINYRTIKLNDGNKVMSAHAMIALDVYGVKIDTNIFMHHKDSNGMNNALDNLQLLDRPKHMSIHAKQGWKKKKEFEEKENHKVVSIESYGYEDTYNITVENDYNFALSAGVIVKNSSIEVKIASVYTQDPSLITYVTDPTTDMHRDTACDIWLIDEKQVTKNIRFHSKGGWVFSQFYGSFYVHCGEDLWKLCVLNEEHLADGTPMSEHLHDNKIHNKTDFINHLKGVEDIFWNERFKVYKQWKLAINKQYRRNGYIENHYGFRFIGYMNDKEVTNYPIQSTAFHVLLEALTEVNRIAKNDKWKSYIIGQIHDSILLYIHPDEVDNVMKVCNRVMSKDVPERHDWITVPIGIEFELSNTSWWDKKEVSIPE